MKLRCTTDSIRLRVRKSDLDQLEAEGSVTASVNFAAGVLLQYSLKIGEVSTPTATFLEHRITVELPTALAKAWINSETVGIEYQQDLGTGQSLHLLVEKDFPCKHTEEKDLQDTFYELASKNDTQC